MRTRCVAQDERGTYRHGEHLRFLVHPWIELNEEVRTLFSFAENRKVMDKNEGRKSKRDCEIQEDMKRKKSEGGCLIGNSNRRACPNE
jgi:hypothetical protein